MLILMSLLVNIGLGNALSIGIASRLTDEFTEDSDLTPSNTKKLKCQLKVLKVCW